MQIFYNSLNGNQRLELDRDGAFMSKTYAKACQLIKDMPTNSYMWLVDMFIYNLRPLMANTVKEDDKY